MTKYIQIIKIVTVVLLLSSCGSNENDSAVVIPTHTVSLSEAATSEIEAICTVRSNNPLKIYSIYDEVIETIYKDKGDVVKKGEILFSYHKDNIQSQINNLKFELKRKENKLSFLKGESSRLQQKMTLVLNGYSTYYDDNKERLESTKEKFLEKIKQQLPESVDYIRAKNNTSDLIIEIASLKSQIKDKAKRLESYDFYSPKDGIIINANIALGRSGSQSDLGSDENFLYLIGEPTNLESFCSVNELQALGINLDDSVNISFPSLTEQEPINATVDTIDPELKSESGITKLSFSASFSVDDKSRVRPGMRAIAKIKPSLNSKSESIYLPLSSVENVDGGFVVYKKVQDQFVKVVVTVKRTNNGYELMDGLNIGDLIASYPSMLEN